MKSKNLFKYLLFIIAFGIVDSSSAEIKKTIFKSKVNHEVKKWQVLDISFNAKSGKPFNADFYAIFQSPSGKEQKVDGFYNDDNQWIIRFSGSEVGEWIYTTRSEISALNNKKGKLTIIEDNAETSKGGIVISKNNARHFSYEDGSPYFLMAFECDWLYSLDYHNKEGLPKTEHLLSLLNQNGFNQVVMNVFSYDVKWKKDELLKEHPEHEFGAPEDIFPFLGNNKNPDYSELNIDFFKNLDRTINLMNEKNIVSHLMIYVWNKLVAWPEMYSEADNMYFDYVVKRYGAFPNIMWDISKEALYYGRADDKYILERIDRLKMANSFNRLISVHDYEFCKRNPESVDYISRQDWNYSLYQNMIGDYENYTNKPIFNIEHGGYEQSPYDVFAGSYIGAEQCLRRNYQCAFAGAYSTYYWQGTSWNAIIWNPFEQNEHFYKPKFEYFKNFTTLFTDYQFSQYEPYKKYNRAGYCLKSTTAEKYLYYVPQETYWYVASYLFKEYKTIRYKWFNTITGEYTKDYAITKEQSFISPWYGDADVVLIVEGLN